MRSEIAAVIVHHRSYASLGNVVRAILDQGVLPQNLVVVDNSEEPSRRDELRGIAANNVEVIFSDNRGYGAAVNLAIEHFGKRPVKPRAFLVSTHESRPAPEAVQHLWNALMETPEAAVTGPTLISGESGKEYVWSTGGFLDKLTCIPKHHDHRAALDILEGRNKPKLRQWLDGAFLLYRWEDISGKRLPEHYFLYMEETDLHTQFCRDGREVIWVPAAHVWQDSRGIPPYYFARNLRLFLAAHGGLARSFAVPAVSVLRKIIGDIARGRGLENMREYVRGLTAVQSDHRTQSEPETTRRDVLLVNPLGAALRHYESELQSVLSAAGASVRVIRFLEPSASDAKASRWLVSYVLVLIRTRFYCIRKNYRVIVLWPVLGYFDVAVMGLLRFENASLVMHDPDPLVRSVGYSNMTKRFSSIWSSKVRLIAHSEKAEKHICRGVGKVATSLLPHPILEPSEKAKTKHGELRPKVRVFGQYKADRDLKALVKLGEDFREVADLEVYGRGWPEVEGWRVMAGFVPEDRLDELIEEASVVVIPYVKFFQSGIAIRAMELGTLFVGPRDSVLAEMLESVSPLLVAAEDGYSGWTQAVKNALGCDPQATYEVARRWREHNVDAWSNWIRKN